MIQWHILIIDAFPAQLIKNLKLSGNTITYIPDCSGPEAIEGLKSADILLINSKINLNATTMAGNNRLKLICRAGVGLDHFDLPFLSKLGIKVCFTPGANAVSVAEHAIGMLVGLLHRIPLANQQVKKRIWSREPNRGIELMGKTIGIIGYGNTGSSFAKILRGFQVQILAVDKYNSGFGNDWVKECGWDEIADQADILSLHVPLTLETKYLVNESLISRFRKNFWLLNTSRGEIVKTADLLPALKSGKICGAGLDVLENEKINQLSEIQQREFDELIEMDNVILSPHIAGWSFESRQRISNEIEAQILAFQNSYSE